MENKVQMEHLQSAPHLRPYQRDALNAVRDAYKAGKRRVIVSLPTGTGKTVVFAHFPRALNMKKRLLVLAHREELLLQAQDKFRSIDPELKAEIEQAGAHAAADAKVVIASVPTLARNGARLSRLQPDEFSIIVVDEAHHAVAPSYRRIFDHFGLFEPRVSRYLIGFTATPRRGDKQGLGEVFEDVCYARDIREMIAARYLCPITGWRVDTDLSLDNVKVRHGDFVESQLACVVNTPSRNNLLVKAYQDFASGRRAIVFCVDVAHAKEVHHAFAEAGIRAAPVWGDLSRDQRRSTLARFSTGEIDVVTNCNLLTEGFDEPRVDCVIMARPTRSKLLYAQMLGRGTRLHPAKKDLMVIDVADNSRAHQLPGLHSLFNLPLNMNLNGGNALQIEREIERLSRTQPWIDISRIQTLDDLKIAAERIEFFNFEPPAEIRAYTRNTWHAVPAGYRLVLPDGEWTSIEPNLLDTWDIRLSTVRHSETLLSHAESLVAAVQFADRFVAVNRPHARRLVERSARWRDELPSDKQREVLIRNKIPVPAGLTRGQAAQMISQLVCARSFRSSVCRRSTRIKEGHMT
ncbi:MAG TPA: DEAD/DEAH box helicase [Terriglobales bacterium]|nr:DEAD/DEAH box helicase [Terriglobales bacterium]